MGGKEQERETGRSKASQIYHVGMYTQICSIHHMIKDKGNTEHLSNNQNTNEWGMGVSKGVSREQMSRNRGCPSTDVLEQGLPLYLMSYGTLSRE